MSYVRFLRYCSQRRGPALRRTAVSASGIRPKPWTVAIKKRKEKKTMRYNGLWFEINDPLFISLLDVLQLSLSNTSDFRPVLDYLHTSSWIASDVCNICDRFGEISRRDWISPFRSHPSWFPGRKSPVIWRRLLASPIRLLSLTYSR